MRRSDVQNEHLSMQLSFNEAHSCFKLFYRELNMDQKILFLETHME